MSALAAVLDIECDLSFRRRAVEIVAELRELLLGDAGIFSRSFTAANIRVKTQPR